LYSFKIPAWIIEYQEPLKALGFAALVAILVVAFYWIGKTCFGPVYDFVKFWLLVHAVLLLDKICLWILQWCWRTWLQQSINQYLSATLGELLQKFIVQNVKQTEL